MIAEDTKGLVANVQPEKAGALVLELLGSLSAEDVPWVYLRNYENLPDDVGNDVDLLVSPGCRGWVAEFLTARAQALGWECVGRGDFSPIALYLVHVSSGAALHLDLFDRLEWHCLEYADAGKILDGRKWNGQVYIPDGGDEVFLNLVTRLLYHGTIREKHREQATSFAGGAEGLKEGFLRHLGKGGEAVAEGLVSRGWEPVGSDRRGILTSAFKRFALGRPGSLVCGVFRYVRRILGKILIPPGRFIVFEGADGVGKSTVLEEVVPWCKKWCGGRDAYRFHWKPMRVSREVPGGSGPVDPRGRPPRSVPASLVFLAWHVVSFWWGYFSQVRPRLVKNHAVIGDRYSYDIFLDPRRFRLQLPVALCRWAARMTPQPDLALALVASPESIRGRKPELTTDEIVEYQERWAAFADGREKLISVDADDEAVETVEKVKRAVLEAFVIH